MYESRKLGDVNISHSWWIVPYKFLQNTGQKEKKIEQEQISSEMQTFDGDKLSLT